MTNTVKWLENNLYVTFILKIVVCPRIFLKHNNEDYRTLKLYDQEKNLTSSAIAHMNMFLHGIEDFDILRGDTLRNPAFFEADGLKTFDCVIFRA